MTIAAISGADSQNLFATPAIAADRRTDGSIILKSTTPLRPSARCIGDWLEHWARQAPDRIFLADRASIDTPWNTLTYEDALKQVRSAAAWILAQGLSAERPLVILSDNSVEHALFALAAQHVGVPSAAISPAYSLMSKDFDKLKSMITLLGPGAIYVSGTRPFAAALAAIEPLHSATIVSGSADAGDAISFRAITATPETPDVEKAFAAITPDTIAKFLFTSGSTGTPKAVINTQRMWCANQAMIATMFAFFREEPPVILDWAPWHHTAAGNHDLGLVLYNGGSYYIDEGKPMPGAIEITVENLREIAPSWYFNVPKGYEALLPYLRSDADLRKNFFSRLRVLWFAAAALPQHVFDEMKALARQSTGETIPFLTGLGSTETAPYAMGRMWETDDATNMGLPPPGEEMKLVPVEEKYEVRLKGPNITPGYWRAPELTAQAFDEEGWYRLGDTFTFAGEPAKGLLFRGRLSEDFKLSTGTWVNVGPLRARLIEHFAPLVRDVVITGEGRNEVGALIFLSGQVDRDALTARLASLPSSGSSNRVTRAMVLDEPPSLDAGEMTDKGSINQRAVLARRAD